LSIELKSRVRTLVSWYKYNLSKTQKLAIEHILFFLLNGLSIVIFGDLVFSFEFFVYLAPGIGALVLTNSVESYHGKSFALFNGRFVILLYFLGILVFNGLLIRSLGYLPN